MKFVYFAVALCGMLGAYSTRLYVNGNGWGIIGMYAQGIIPVVMWLWICKTQKNLLVVTALWDAVYALSWAIGIYICFHIKPSIAQLVGVFLIIVGIVLANL